MLRNDILHKRSIALYLIVKVTYLFKQCTEIKIYLTNGFEYRTNILIIRYRSPFMVYRRNCNQIRGES